MKPQCIQPRKRLLVYYFLFAVVIVAKPVQGGNPPPAREQFHVFLLMGQSNMAGFGDLEPGDDKPTPGVFVLGGECDKRTAQPQSAVNWRPAAHPLHNILPSDRFGLGLPFAKAYLATRRDISVGLVPCAWGGADIDQIGPGSATWRNAMARARQAKKTGVLKGVLWHQGESDTVSAERADAYAGKLDALIAQVRKELGEPNLPFIVGDLAPFYGTGPDHSALQRVAHIQQVRQSLRELPSRMAHTAFSGSTGTSSPDRHMVHFDRASYIILGRNYATAFAAIGLPVADRTVARAADYLIDGSPFVAQVKRSEDGRELTLDNGLVRRTWRLSPNGATVGFDNLMTGQAMLRSVRPESRVTIDGIAYDVGGLTGQPNHAFLTPAWLDAMQADPKAMRFIGFEVGEPAERFAWKQRRHAAPNVAWPPKGAYLRMDYAMAPMDDKQIESQLNTGQALDNAGLGGRDNQTAGYAPPSDLGRTKLIEDPFNQLDKAWRIHTSPTHPRSSFENEGKPGEIYTPANTAVYAQRALPKGTRLVEATINAGTDKSASWGPGVALVFKDRVIKFNIRPQGNPYDGNPLLGLWDGQHENTRVGGRTPLNTTKPWTLRLRLTDDAVLCDAKPQDGEWANYGRVSLDKNLGEPQAVRVGKMDVQGGDDDHSQPGELVRLRIMRFAAYSAIDAKSLAVLRKQAEQFQQIRVSVHYEMYDGVPVISKWITVHNDSGKSITVNRFTGEELALVEYGNWVEHREGVAIPQPDYLHVETDFAFGGFNHLQANRHAVHWRPDPLYTTQVNWARQTPCLLITAPTHGPAQTVAPGQAFESFRIFELVHDSSQRERRGLALKRMYRTVAPWVTENPITHHLLNNNPQRVREAVDQAAQVGFETIILSFGSGFNMENRDPKHLEQWKQVADYAEQKGVELGCYSLFSSRGVGKKHMIVSPPGQRATHGKCPAVTSEWGQRWLSTIKDFYAQTGFDQFENDGPYPGDIDVTPRPPLQKGADDSRWVQWRLTADLYRNLRSQGVYINAPDYYYLNGSNKCGMGYREVNWSLPRAHQVIHTRQNIYDGSWEKTPSMGWMFVPLSQYHGGGAAATIEPLDKHLDHYQRMMQSNLAMGVQAHYRGPRLFDTQRTRDMVKRQVSWFKKYRDILESDMIHGRRADGRDLDWMLHVNPNLDHKGLLVVFNPLEKPVEKTIRVNLYYTGLTDRAKIREREGLSKTYQLDRQYHVDIPVRVPGQSMSWCVIDSVSD